METPPDRTNDERGEDDDVVTPDEYVREVDRTHRETGETTTETDTVRESGFGA